MFAIIPDAVDFREFVLLNDGQGVLLRKASSEDVEQVEAFMNGLSKQTLALRFMAGLSRVSRAYVEDLCQWDPYKKACLLAVEGGLSIPFARAICKTIDTAAKRIVVELPEGLKDLNRP